MSQHTKALDVLIGARIREERERRGWSQTVLADKMRALGRPMEKGRLSVIERGVDISPLSTRDIHAAALAFGVDPAALLVSAGASELLDRYSAGGEPAAIRYLVDRLSYLVGKPPADAD